MSRSAEQPLFDRTLDVLSNVMFPVVVFVVWAVATTIGTVIDQNQPPDAYYQEYPMAVANLVVRLHLSNVFHSIPYIALIGLLLVSMAVCTFRRVIPKRFPKDRAVPVENFGLHASVPSGADLSGAAALADEYFRKRGFALRTQDIDGAHWVFADRQKWARYGVLVAHLGFVVIVFGVFLYWRFGFSGQLQIFDRQTVAIPGAGAFMTLNKFIARFVPVQTPGGVFYQASKFESDLTLHSQTGDARATTVVNHPYVSPQGTYFYQASYGYGGRLQVERNGKRLQLSGTDGRLMPQDAVFLPGTSRAIEYGTMLGPSDPSQVPSGVSVPNTDTYALWVFHDNIPTTAKPILLPVGKSLAVGDGYVIRALPPVAWTGLTYRYDPGQGWVGLGAAILVTGFVMSLFFVPVKLYARVRAEVGGVRIAVAATTTKGNPIYEDDFDSLVNGLRRALQAPTQANVGSDTVEAYA